MQQRRFVFEQLSDSVLDQPYHYLDTLNAPDVPTAGQGEDAPKETTDYLQSVYEQTEVWLKAVQSRWSNATVLRDFQRNLRFLTRLLRQSRYPRLALLGRRGGGKSSLINALLGQMVAQPGHIRGTSMIYLLYSCN